MFRFYQASALDLLESTLEALPILLKKRKKNLAEKEPQKDANEGAGPL
jgi:hypothetical protein